MRMAVELAEHHFSVRCGDSAKARPSGTCVFYLHGYNSVTLVVEFQGFTSHKPINLLQFGTNIFMIGFSLTFTRMK